MKLTVKSRSRTFPTFLSRETCSYLRSLLFWDVTQRRLIITDVSRQSLYPVFMGPAVFGPICRAETSVTTNLRSVTSWTSDLSTHPVAFQTSAPRGCELPIFAFRNIRDIRCNLPLFTYKFFVHVTDADHR
jgi:hypothetical protein